MSLRTNASPPVIRWAVYGWLGVETIAQTAVSMRGWYCVDMHEADICMLRLH